MHPQGTETLSRKSTVWKETHTFCQTNIILSQNAWHILLVTPKPTKWMLSHMSVRTATESREQIWQQLSAPLQVTWATQGSVQIFTRDGSATASQASMFQCLSTLTASNFPCSCPLLKGFKFQSNDPILKEKKKNYIIQKKKRVSVWSEGRLSLTKAGPVQKLVPEPGSSDGERSYFQYLSWTMNDIPFSTNFPTHMANAALADVHGHCKTGGFSHIFLVLLCGVFLFLHFCN